MLESNWVRVCELEERSLNVSHCWTDRGETSQHDEKDGVKDHWRRFSKVIQRLHCKLCFIGLTKLHNFYFSTNILYSSMLSHLINVRWAASQSNVWYNINNNLLQSLWKRFKALQNSTTKQNAGTGSKWYEWQQSKNGKGFVLTRERITSNHLFKI